MRIITAAKRLGLYSAFLACRAIFFRSNLQPEILQYEHPQIIFIDIISYSPKLTVDTIFCSCGTGILATLSGPAGVAGITGAILGGGCCP